MTVLDIAQVRTATRADVPRLASTLALAFHDDPAGRWYFPHDASRLRRLERMFRLLFLPKLAVPHGATYTTDGWTGGALWLPPVVEEASPIENLRLLPTMAADLGARAAARDARIRVPGEAPPARAALLPQHPRRGA
jgi:hypothetical protein